MLDSQFYGPVEWGCSASVLGAAAATDPLSIGVTLVIVFFVVLLVALLASFVIFRFKKRTKRTKSPRPVQQHVQHHVSLKQNGAGMGGLKVWTDDAWFAARPSGTEDVYKVYAESFRGEAHLARVLDEARAIVSAALRGC